MKRSLLLFAICLNSLLSAAQDSNTEKESVKKVITRFFDGMRKGDSSMVNESLSRGVIMQTIAEIQGKTVVRSSDVKGFLTFVATPHSEIFDERITFDQVLIDSKLASVWTNYKFYLGEKFSHCGVNSFTLVKEDEGWKISHIIDTRRKLNCN